MCAPVVGAGRNGPYMEGGKGWNGLSVDCLVELPALVLLLPLRFSGAKGKYTFVSL